MGLFSRLSDWVRSETSPEGPSPRDPEEAGDENAVCEVRSRSGTQAVRIIYKDMLTVNLKMPSWPEHYLDYEVDMLMTAKRNGAVEFSRVFRECREDADELVPSQKAAFLAVLAKGLQDKQFSRFIRGRDPEHDWYVLACTADALDEPAPRLNAVRGVHSEKGTPYIERDEVPLFDVFYGLKTDREE